MSDVTRAIQTTGSLDWLREDFPDVKATPGTASGGKQKAKDGADKKPLPDAAAFFRPQAQQIKAISESIDATSTS